MKTLSSPLPIPVDHNPFDFYSHHEKPPGLERQASKQPTTRSEEDLTFIDIEIIGGRNCDPGSKAMESCLL